nr:acylneuraminate cytidylyltransferase family protein [Crassaminicella thermophila]
MDEEESSDEKVKKDRSIIAIIPARGGSKGIKNKNIKYLIDKPLISYTIEAAKKSKYIDRIVVTTDDIEIKKVSEQFGVEVPFIRPKELAQDDTPGIEPIIHAVKWLEDNEGYRADYVINLQPTSPLRTSEDIDQAVEKLLNSNSISLVSVCESSEHPYWMKKIENGIMQSFLEVDIKNKNYRRQDLPKVYSLNGAIYMSTTENLVSNKSFYSENTLPYIMPKERSIDIDDMIDFKLAELTLRGEIND